MLAWIMNLDFAATGTVSAAISHRPNFSQGGVTVVTRKES